MQEDHDNLDFVVLGNRVVVNIKRRTKKARDSLGIQKLIHDINQNVVIYSGRGSGESCSLL